MLDILEIDLWLTEKLVFGISSIVKLGWKQRDSPILVSIWQIGYIDIVLVNFHLSEIPFAVGLHISYSK